MQLWHACCVAQSSRVGGAASGDSSRSSAESSEDVCCADATASAAAQQSRRSSAALDAMSSVALAAGTERVAGLPVAPCRTRPGYAAASIPYGRATRPSRAAGAKKRVDFHHDFTVPMWPESSERTHARDPTDAELGPFLAAGHTSCIRLETQRKHYAAIAKAAVSPCRRIRNHAAVRAHRRPGAGLHR